MNDDMVDRVAWAIHCTRCRWPETARIPAGWDWVGEVNKERAYEMAGAALKAMREPTQEMITAGDVEGYGNGPEIVVDIWQRMIDRASWCPEIGRGKK